MSCNAQIPVKAAQIRIASNRRNGVTRNIKLGYYLNKSIVAILNNLFNLLLSEKALIALKAEIRM